MRSLRNALGTGVALALIWALAPLDGHAVMMVEDFSDGGSSGFDPAFNHVFSPLESTESHDFVENFGDFSGWSLGLWPSQDDITFNLAAGQYVDFASVMMVDGGGNSSVTFNGTLDSATFSTSAGFPTIETFTTTGLALGDIVSISLRSFEGAFDNIEINVVPEPSTASLVAFGLAGLAARRKRAAASTY